jgi:regulator of sigma E protease
MTNDMSMLAFSIIETFTDHVWPILAFLLGLGALVFVHELGHFIVARWVGIRVETFAIGMGPRVCGIRRKGTDYCLRAIPFGGYVKMTGQEDFGSVKDSAEDPESFMSKTIGQRFAVVAAGVIMNLIFASIAFVGIGLIGIDVKAPIIGDILPHYPASEAAIVWEDGVVSDDPEVDTGLKPGDRILSINDRRIDRFAKISTAAMLARRDETFVIVFERDADGQTRLGTMEVGLKPGVSPSGEANSKVLKFGVSSAATLEFGKIEDDLYPEDGFDEGDRVIAIDGQPIEHHWELIPISKALDGSPVQVTVRTAFGELVDEHLDTAGAAPAIGLERTVTVTPKLYMGHEDYKLVFLKDGTLLRTKLDDPGAVEEDKDEDEDKETLHLTLLDGSTLDIQADDQIGSPLLDVAGMAPRMAVQVVQDGSPARKAGLLPGDIVISYGRRQLPTFQQFQEVNKEFLGEETEIVVLRGDKTEALSIKPKEKKDRPLVGIELANDRDHLIVADVRVGSPAHAAGVLPGSTITSVSGQPVATWPELINAVASLVERNAPIVLAGENIDGLFTAELPALTADTFRADEYRYMLFPVPRFEPLLKTIRFSNPLHAIVWGGRESFDYARIGYASLRAMVTGTVSLKEVRGPLGMGQVAVNVVRHGGAMQFFNFMALISVLLAVFNFLPLPVVDGGLAVLLIVEKIRGKPLNTRLLNIIQTVGVVLLIGVFLLITWRDLLRIINDLLTW